MMTIKKNKTPPTKQQMLYIHIPFCNKKCYYCNYVSYKNKLFVKEYFKALENEIIERKNNITVASIFIGGGTPTCVECIYIEKVLKTIKKHYTIAENCEITIEANPQSTNKEKLES